MTVQKNQGDGLCCAPCPPVCSAAVSATGLCLSLWPVMGLPVSLLIGPFPFPSFLSLEASCAGAVSL